MWPRFKGFATINLSVMVSWLDCAARATVRRLFFPHKRFWVLERMGITVPQAGSRGANNMQVKNMAGVFVVATLPPFSGPGSKLDVTVSSAGDARSLEGGILLMTPLYGPDGKIFAEAQGALVLGGYMAAGGGSSRQMNHPTTARVPEGALVERSAA